MTPKEKAKELVNKFSLLSPQKSWASKNYGAIECALIAVDEILDLDFNIGCDATERCVNPVMKYWEEVKQEIEKEAA